MKNEQNVKKRKPLLRVGLTALISAVIAVAGYFISGSVTIGRDLIVLSLGSDAIAAGIETGVAVVNKIKNKNSVTNNSKSRNRARNKDLQRSQDMDKVPVEEQTVNVDISSVNASTKENTKKQGR